jgi:long-chain acyl-CoA synthetase
MPARAHWASAGDPGLRSLNQLLVWQRDAAPNRCLAVKRAGEWVRTSGPECFAQVRALAARLGARPGERIAILSESRPEWLIADLACLAAGVVNVPIYPTLTAGQAAFILQDSRAVGAFVSTPEQLAKLESVRAALPDLRWLCSFDSPAWQAQVAPLGAEDEAGFVARLQATPGEQLASLIYTSGTTGRPKGVRLTHANLCANLNVSTLDFHFGADEIRLSILPLSHITERHLAYVDMLYDAATYFATSLDTVAAELIEVRPTVLVSAPRLFEKVAAAVRSQASGGLKRGLLAWALRAGGRLGPYRLAGTAGAAPPWLRGQAALAGALVGRKLKAKLGGRLDKIIAGGAPLGRELAEFFLALGLVVDEGYGLTETSPVIALNRPGARRPGSIGRPLPNLDVKFAGDGELLVRGASVFAGYEGLPEETAAAFDGGWFKTGDIGRQDADGFLYITDRKKDLIKTSGGKFIAPQPIEAQLKASGLIAEAVLVGDGRNYVSALLVPNWDAVAARGLAGPDRAAACGRDDVRALFAAEVGAVNATLARFETVKRFALLPEPFTIASGELTPTIKVRRRTVEQRHAATIAALYADGQAAGYPG